LGEAKAGTAGRATTSSGAHLNRDGFAAKRARRAQPAM